MPLLEINVLGPVSVRLRNCSIVPTAGKPRQVLALLALRCGRAVSASTLMSEIWGDAVPRSGPTTLQTYVLQLRRRIEGSLPAGSNRTAKELLARSYNGYQLVAAPRSFDLAEFDRLAASGSAALAKCDAESASRYLGQALDLWRGPVLVDVPMGRVLAAAAATIEDARARVLEQRIVADLHLGRHAALIPELRKLVAAHPADENTCALLMIALQRSGALPRALQVFEDLGRALGGEPSACLQRLRQELLEDPARIEVSTYFPVECGLPQTV
ncbi:AfsR/SARP family transcriptional regulator [Saccharopolyspora elongata]|uniref:AfsR/SARP family transcriptional regulator n=1 Tax=Saccharopolyspora elongata TaxID=2530387 RepID=UPI001A9F3D68|nr:AfsR/SARP family transcriptional regulator [Saccharopolyspora elongata]